MLLNNAARIKIILKETYEICEDVLGVKFNIDCNSFISQIDKYIENRVFNDIILLLPSDKYPELCILVNIKKKKVLCKLSNKRLQVILNRYLKFL